MNPLFVIGLLIVLLLYIIAMIFSIRNISQINETTSLIGEIENRESKIFVFNYERSIINKLHVKPEKIKGILYLERILLLAIIVLTTIILKGLALALFGALTISFIFDDLYKKDLYKSGILNVSKVMNFINFFVPHITSGHSAEQSFLEYIQYAKDEDLKVYFENKDNPDVKILPHLRQIIDIYDIAKYNEEKGINDYTYILNEMEQDMSQKQTYYNSFISRIGEIRPICWSYYIGVPLLIVVSYSNTYTFWQAGGGWIIATVLLALFGLFKFLIYKLQKKTIETIF